LVLEHRIELAYEQGILRKKDLGPIQLWALNYYLKRRQQKETDKYVLFRKDLMFIANQSMYQAIYGEKKASDEEGYLDVDRDDFDAIERHLAKLDREQTMNAKDDQGWI
jgi:hypothetical protein